MRGVFRGEGKGYTTAHLILAALDQRLYFTTNYDSLFEKAWKDLNDQPIEVITNDQRLREQAEPLGVDLDASRMQPDRVVQELIAALKREDRALLIKLHGCASRDDEALVLTRSEYRRHYRFNSAIFDVVKGFIASGQMLFLGFSHRDPEVSRLVEDAVHFLETKRSRSGDARKPGIYSLHYDLGQRSAEVFAARGMVALQPPLVSPSPSEVNVVGTSIAVGLLCLGRRTEQLDTLDDLDDSLSAITTRIHDAVQTTVRAIEQRVDAVATCQQHRDEDGIRRILGELVAANLPLANQGFYYANAKGGAVVCAVPPGLDAAHRERDKVDSPLNLSARPYFQQAASFRRTIVSDVYESIYNRNATLFFCVPIVPSQRFCGVIFSAHNVRGPKDASDPNDQSGDVFHDARRLAREKHASLLIVDANGMCLIPPDEEFRDEQPTELLVPGEDHEANRGYRYGKLLHLARRDRRVERIARNVVPLEQDDDVFALSPDVTVYSAVGQVDHASWKIAVSKFFS
jgi:hypothetical protein